MGHTGSKGLVPFFMGGNIEDRVKDQDVRQIMHSVSISVVRRRSTNPDAVGPSI